MAKWKGTMENLVTMNYKEIFTATYKGKRVLLTGHTGFKGSWMLGWLHQLGAIVKGYALQPEGEKNLYNLIDGDSLCNSVIDDIRNSEKLLEVVKEFQPEFIFHLAAQPLVRKSYELPQYTFEVNAMGTANLLEAAKSVTAKCSVVIVTTDKVYENNESGIPFKENDKLGGYDPYSASKAVAEIIVSSYRDSFFNSSHYSTHQKSIASARAGNVIGGGDMSLDRILPDIIRGADRNEPVVVRSPDSIRPWQFVLEPLCGYLLLGARLSESPVTYNEAWNFGPHTEDILTVREVVEKSQALLNKGTYVVPENIVKVHEASLLMLDISKAINKLGWTPVYTATESIEKTVEGYLQMDAGKKDFIYQQIEAFYKASIA